MAYTYDDFLSYLPKAGLTEQDFSPEDLRLAQQNPQAGVALLDAKFDWKNAQTDDERALANAKANQVRSQAGYSGGIDGMNGNVSLTPDDMPGYNGGVQSSVPQTSPQSPQTAQISFTPMSYTPPPAPQYNAPAAYNNPYAGQQNQLLDDMTNYKPFESAPYSNQYTDKQQGLLDDMLNYGQFDFDPSTSPLYSSYKKQYAREGNRAMQDTLGSLSAATGGRPSTAAATAASQANDYHMSQLGDKLPQIYESEYNKYLQDFNMMGQKLGAVNEMEGVDYSRYWDGKNFDYGKYLDDYSRMQGNLGAVNELAAQDRGDYESDRNYGLNLYGQQRGDYEADRNYALGEYNVRRGDYESDRNFDYGRQLDEMERARLAEQTAYNQSRDALSDEQLRGETERRSRLDSDARMMDLWKAQGRASPEVAAYFGVPAGTYYGGEESELALAQARANIANTQAATANRGQNSTSQPPPTPGDVTDGNAIDAAIDRLYGGTGTQNDIQTLIDAEYDTKDLKEAFPDMFGGTNADAVTATDWRDAYDEASLTQYKIQTEDDIQKLLDKGYYTLEMNANGKLKIRRISH